MSGTYPIARVIVELALDREFDYLIPESLRGAIVIGSRVEVPFGRGWQFGFVVALLPTSSYAEPKVIKRVVGEGSYLNEEVLKLARWISDYYVCPFELCVRTVLPAPIRKNNQAFKRQAMLSITDAGRALLADADYEKKSPRQAAVLRWLGEQGTAPRRDAAHACAATPAVIKALLDKGAVTTGQTVDRRDPFKDHEVLPTTPLTLMPQQEEALRICREAIDWNKASVLLLHGVTGSGKTEVYLQAIAHAIQCGKGAIVLVPEIALTPQTVDRFRGRFGDVVAVLHSDLSDGERHDEWHRIRRGDARIVVGARSALFAPVPALGLIVVDEEHEASYKQDEAPRYNARDMAVVRGHLAGCAVVLGSATPSLESVLNVRKGKYREVRMPHRIDHRTMPHMRIVDLAQGREGNAKPHALSQELVEAIRQRLDRAEQTILFLNRRGFSSSLICPQCGEAPKCDQCSVTLTYHKATQKLMCHFCGAEHPVPARCPNPNCRDPNFRHGGLGTQRIEEVVKRIFPQARIHRMDSDTMTRRDAYRTVLGDFRSGKIDILLGTQMIAKGLDFPNVTLVGVVLADMSLQVPDFRSAERTFQLLTQVAGRAGRGDISGEVIVQTFSPHHWAIQSARRMDFDTFADQELAFREELEYPPYAHLVCVTCRGEDAERVERRIGEVVAAMKSRAASTVSISGPAPSPLARLKGQYRFQALFRAKTAVAITRPLREVIRELKGQKDVHLAIDVDALDLI
ncbi:MAG TPA: primosomal protein N' [Kiritimatiellia bacterium]|nr:primosomal protein N' [Kiritimatiellia bacterium]HMO99390.1 primosomal protein N' [Kiritimatiellia bacterium]HMP97732.1 primosomal protein N' [Kiritimatiellia bacterium]